MTTPEPQMTMGAWIFLAIGWFAVTTLAVWCFRRVLRPDRSDDDG